MTLWRLIRLWRLGYDPVAVIEQMFWQDCECKSQYDGKIWLDNYNMSAYEHAQALLLADRRITRQQCMRAPFTSKGAAS